jgi:hypothetical protein
MQDDLAQLDSAWADWCGQLKAAGEDIMASDIGANDKAEGLRWLTRLTRYGLEAGVEFADPDCPAFYMPTHETVKIMSDNPDAKHWMATIRDDSEYILQGTRGTCARIMFTTLSRKPEGGMEQMTGIDTSDLSINADGNFAIRVGRKKHDGNWLELKDGAQSLLVRALFFDRKTDTPPIIRLDQICADGTPAPLDPKRFAQKLHQARKVALGSVGAITAYAEEMRECGWVNAFGRNPKGWAAGDPGVEYLHGTWELARDETLVIALSPPDCYFWNAQINNRWAESLDYLHRRIHVNSQSAATGSDGNVRIVIAHEDPGLPNWLDTDGHCEGTMLVRAIDAQDAPKAACQVVKFAALKGAP